MSKSTEYAMPVGIGANVKRTYNILYLFLILTLYGCKSAEEKRIEKVEKISNNVIFTTANQLIQFHEKLQFIGFGGGGARGLNNLSIAFNYYKEMNIETSRKLIVDCVEKFLTNINKDKELRPHLKVYPFRPVNVEITISVKIRNRMDSVDFMAARDGNVEYYHYSENDNRVLILEELYETALEIVRHEGVHMHL